MAWYRKLVAGKFDRSKAHQSPGRSRIKREVEKLILRMASENRDWGYGRIAVALADLGHKISDLTVGNILRRHGLPPAPERKRTSTWAAFVRTHVAPLAGIDFFTAEVLTLRGLMTYYVLFFIHLESRRVDIVGITVHPDEANHPERDHGRSARAAGLSLFPARSGHEIHPVVPGHPYFRRG
jgi:hypothetical protein